VKSENSHQKIMQVQGVKLRLQNEDYNSNNINKPFKY